MGIWNTRVIRIALGWLVAIAAAGTSLAGELADKPLVERLLDESGKIQSLQCELRRETEAGGATVRALNRVWFQRPDRLRVETATPEARRIVVDGTAIHKWMDGQAAGTRTLLTEAEEWDLFQVRRVPATADEYLLRLRGTPESALPPEAGFPIRRAYTPSAPHPYTVLSLDETNRLARLEYFSPDARSNCLLRVDFGGWKEAKPGIWIACLQKIDIKGSDGTAVRETLRVGTLTVNEPIEPEQFDAARWMPGVKFITPEAMLELLPEDEKRRKN